MFGQYADFGDVDNGSDSCSAIALMYLSLSISIFIVLPLGSISRYKIFSGKRPGWIFVTARLLPFSGPFEFSFYLLPFHESVFHENVFHGHIFGGLIFGVYIKLRNAWAFTREGEALFLEFYGIL